MQTDYNYSIIPEISDDEKDTNILFKQHKNHQLRYTNNYEVCVCCCMLTEIKKRTYIVFREHYI
ncbi:MAG: hypothetical protein K2O36_06140, partial [Ruminococcus sp.]|nr:hypothetical protein [Ruminococcus sp.]